MTFEKLRDRCTTLVQAALAAGAITDPVEWPNVKFAQPATGCWLRFTIQSGNSSPASLGTRTQQRKDTPLILILQVFVPIEGGSKRPYQIADALSQQMDLTTERTTAGTRKLTLSFETWSIEPIGATGGFQQFNLTLKGRAIDLPA